MASSSLNAATLESALSLAGVGCCLWQPEDRITFSSGFAALLGHHPDDVPGNIAGWLNLTHPDDQAKLHKLFDALRAGEHAEERFSLRLRHANSLWCWFELRSSPAENGNALISFTEATPQVQAMTALRESQLRYRALYDTSPLAFVLWDRQGRIVEWNRRSEQMFGWKSTQVIGKPIHRLLLPDELHGRFSDHINAFITG